MLVYAPLRDTQLSSLLYHWYKVVSKILQHLSLVDITLKGLFSYCLHRTTKRTFTIIKFHTMVVYLYSY